MTATKKARYMLMASTAIWGTLGVFVRKIPVSSAELALYRAVLAVVLISGFLLVSKQKIPFREIKKEIPALLLSGVGIGINWIFLFEAYKYTTVSVATLSYYFAPVLITVLCAVLFREKLTAKQIFCFAMSTAGIVMITGIGDMTGGSRNLIGIALGLGAAVLYASVFVVNKFIRNVSGIHRTLLQFLAVIAVLIPYVAFTGGVTLGTMDAAGWVNLLVVGLVHTGVTYCLYFNAMKELPGQTVAILGYIDPLIAVILSVTVLGEAMTLSQALGGLLILGFTLLNELKKD